MMPVILWFGRVSFSETKLVRGNLFFYPRFNLLRSDFSFDMADSKEIGLCDEGSCGAFPGLRIIMTSTASLGTLGTYVNLNETSKRMASLQWVSLLVTFVPRFFHTLYIYCAVRQTFSALFLIKLCYI